MNYIEASPALFRRLDALPATAQHRLWSAIDRANHQLARVLIQQESYADRIRQQDDLINRLLDTAAELWDTQANQLTSPGRRQHLAAARRQVAALCQQRWGWSAARIGRRLRRDRATIHRALHRHQQDLRTDPAYAYRYHALQLTVNG